MQPDYSLLQGLALVEQLGEEQAVVLYPARGLSQDPATRFAQLFAMRPRSAPACQASGRSTRCSCSLHAMPGHTDVQCSRQRDWRTCTLMIRAPCRCITNDLLPG